MPEHDTDDAGSGDGRRVPARLRNGIVARIGLLVAGLSLVLGLSTYTIVENTLVDEQDRSAEQQQSTNALVLSRALADDGEVDADQLLSSLRPRVRAGELLRRDGTWSTTSSDIGPDDLPDDLVAEVEAGATSSRRLPGDQLVVGARLPEGSLYFEAFDLAPLEETLSTLRRALIASGALATLAGMGIALLLARQVTRPLEGVADAASQIASGDLDVRMAPSHDRDLGRISDAFNRMADTLQARIARESRFAADVSHELRSPMTTLVNASTVLQHRRDELSGDGQEALDLLVGDVERFRGIIADLTEMSKHDAGTIRPDLERVPVERAVRDAIARIGRRHLEPRATRAGARAEILVDLQRLERAFDTILENADAYAGGATGIEVDADETQVHIHLDDDGPGVPAEEQERIFERFARGVHGERRTTADGSGLGLSLARENVRVLGGTIVAGARPDGSGARFTISLPRVTG